MVEAILDGCAQCPGTAAGVLGELAGQYVPPEQWLSATPDERQYGHFSLDAVRVATQYHRMNYPAHPSYGRPRDFVTFDFDKLQEARKRLEQGEPLTPDDIGRMTRMAMERDRRRHSFLARSPDSLRAQVRLAQPFLEDVAADLFAQQHPEADTIRAVEKALQQRQQNPSPMQETAASVSNVLRGMRGIHRVHALDQLPFIVARTALEKCDGPWVCAKPRLLFLRPRTITVCPYGERDKDYAYAQNVRAAGGQPA